MGILSDLGKNPSFLLIAGVGVALFVFKDKISDFFNNITGGIEAATTAGEITQTALDTLQGNQTGLINAVNDLTKGFTQFQTDVGTQFSGLGDLFSNLFNQNQGEQNPPIILDDQSNVPKELDCECGTVINQDINGIVTTFCSPCPSPMVDPFFVPPEEANLFPPAPALADNRRVDINQENFNVQTDIEGNQFRGGGVSFIGGTVRETPITAQSTLGFIIDRLGVSASRAASIRAGLLGFSPEEELFLNQGQEISPLGDLANQPQTSGGFSGLTPQEIALRLTGGIISNF